MCYVPEMQIMFLGEVWNRKQNTCRCEGEARSNLLLNRISVLGDQPSKGKIASSGKTPSLQRHALSCVLMPHVALLDLEHLF